jgi:hypothetical protein
MEFYPKTGSNSTKDSKPVFMFGNHPVYLDSNVIFALRGSWMEQKVSSVMEIMLAMALIPTMSNAVAVMETTPAIHMKAELSM